MSLTTDIVYVLCSRKLLSKADALDSLEMVFARFALIDNTLNDCTRAYESEMPGYEDALIAYAAERNGIDFIITRNKKDFLKSPVPALTPEEFVAIYKPGCLEYGMVDS